MGPATSVPLRALTPKIALCNQSFFGTDKILICFTFQFFATISTYASALPNLVVPYDDHLAVAFLRMLVFDFVLAKIR